MTIVVLLESINNKVYDFTYGRVGEIVSANVKEWQKQILYKKLVEAYPELKETSPGIYKRLNPFHDKTSIKLEPFTGNENLIILLANVEKKIFTEKTADYFTKKYGLPDTKIKHLKRSMVITLVDIIKPIASLIFGTYHEGKKRGILKKGDIKIEIHNGYHEYSANGFLINHKTQEAKYLYEKRKNPKYEPSNISSLKFHYFPADTNCFIRYLNRLMKGRVHL